MKQLTIRFNERVEKELESIKEMLDCKSNHAVSHAVDQYLFLLDKNLAMEKEIAELKSIIKYLESNRS